MGALLQTPSFVGRSRTISNYSVAPTRAHEAVVQGPGIDRSHRAKKPEPASSMLRPKHCSRDS